MPSPRAITPLCDSIGEKLVANYDISWFQWLGIVPRQPMWRCGDDAMTEPFLGRVACSKQGVVGPFDEDPCLGRCGPGCTDLFVVNDKVFSRECFTHDVCVGGTGDSPLPLCLFGGPWCGPCANEFLAAVDSFFTGDPSTEHMGRLSRVVVPGFPLSEFPFCQCDPGHRRCPVRASVRCARGGSPFWVSGTLLLGGAGTHDLDDLVSVVDSAELVPGAHSQGIDTRTEIVWQIADPHVG